MKSDLPGKNKKALTMERTFNAPQKLVFEAFSSEAAMAEWWGPVGYKLTVARFDFKPGGMFLYKMESSERTMWARFIYGRIEAPALIEFTLSFSNEDGGITRAPFFDMWPLEIFNSIRLIEKNDQTTILFEAFPINASQEEFNSFVREAGSFQQGFGATLDTLEHYLAK